MMNFNYEQLYILDPKLEFITRNDEYLFINYDDVKWFRTNTSGHELLMRFDGRSTLSDILHQLTLEYGINIELLTSIYQEFIIDAVKSGVLLENAENEEKDQEVSDNDLIHDLRIHVTKKCNLSCSYCYENTEMENIGLNCEKILHFLQGIEEAKRNNIIITGGEPFLYDDLTHLTRELNRMNFKNIQILTNGTIGSEKYEEIIPYIHEICVSIDGTTEEIHDLQRGEGSFKKIIENLILLKKLGLKKLSVSFTPTGYNLENMPSIPDFAKNYNVNHIFITRFVPNSRCKLKIDNFKISMSKYNDYFDEFLQNYSRLIKTIIFENENKELNKELVSLSLSGDKTLKITDQTKKTNCGAGLKSMSINYDGNIYPCAFLHKESLKLGTLDDELHDLRVRAKVFSNRYSVDNLPLCKDCKLKYFCGGGCRACALEYSCENNIYDIDPMCERFKTKFIDLAYMLNSPIATGIKSN